MNDGRQGVANHLAAGVVEAERLLTRIQTFDPIEKLMEFDFTVIVPDLNFNLELEQVTMRCAEVLHVIRSRRVLVNPWFLKRDCNHADFRFAGDHSICLSKE